MITLYIISMVILVFISNFDNCIMQLNDFLSRRQNKQVCLVNVSPYIRLSWYRCVEHSYIYLGLMMFHFED